MKEAALTHKISTTRRYTLYKVGMLLIFFQLLDQRQPPLTLSIAELAMIVIQERLKKQYGKV